MKKRILASLLAISIFTTTGIVCFAENDATDQQKAVTTGTQERVQENSVDVDADIEEEIAAQVPEDIETIEISSADEFMEFVDNCKLNTWSDNKRVILTQDISLVGKDFYGVPDFGGIFDGQDHTISEISIDTGESYVGTFVHVEKDAVIKNLNVSGTIIPSGSPVIVGGIAGENYGTIQDCSFKGVVKANDYVGGLVGMNQLSGNISFCTTEGFVSGIHFTGGIAGLNVGNIVNCRNEAMVNTTNTDTEITVDSMENLNKVLSLFKNGINKEDDEANTDVTITDVGGIAGQSVGIIARCINNGEIGYEHVGYNVGGIAGRQSGYMLSCSNNGKIKGRKDVGGIVGQAEPYVTVDFASDIAYQLQEAVAQLHDTVSVTLNDTKNQSDTISSRLALIQKFTGSAIEDARYLANGTIDYANDISTSTNEAFERVEYALDESSKSGGPIDNFTNATQYTKKSIENMENAVKDLAVEEYITSEDERQQYENAKNGLVAAAETYQKNYNEAYPVYYNYYLTKHRNEEKYNDLYSNSSDLRYYDSNGELVSEDDWPGDLIFNDLECKRVIEEGNSMSKSGTWRHSTDMAKFPSTEKDSALDSYCKRMATEEADEYARDRDIYVNPVTGSNDYSEDLATQAAVLAAIYSNHAEEMKEQARKDAMQALSDLDASTSYLSNAGSQTKSIISNLAGRDDIRFPQLDDEYRAHSNSLADNMAAMNDNFGLLNAEMNNATGVVVDDLQAVNDQFNNILNLYTDALDGVLDKDYTSIYTDDSYEEAAYTTDATIDSCFNFGKCAGDIDVSGIAGTMAVEYDFDKESDITGIKDANLNTSYITKCVLRDNRNYGNIKSQKDYAGGVCGLQEMGTILNCGSYSKIESKEGKYVGGVAGSSMSYIVESYAKGELDAASYVGGIAGDGMHIKDCLTLVDVQNADSWYGAIAGHVAENGEVRNNFFVSETLSGIDRVSYSLKAEPVSYEAVQQNKVFEEIEEKTEESEQELEVVPLSTGSDEAVTKSVKYRDLPHEFSNITINFVLEDEDLEDGIEQVDRINKQYGEALTEDEYPEIPAKEGCYVDWDIPEVDRLVCDVTATATYKPYRTTLAIDDSADLHQSILLVDGKFRDDDKIEALRTITYDGLNSTDVEQMEVIDITIPDDGQTVHQIRFKPEDNTFSFMDKLERIAGSEIALYEVTENTKVKLVPTGKMGAYNTYDLEGNTHTLAYGMEGVGNIGLIIIALVLLLFVLIIVIIIIIVNIIKRHGGKVPRIFNRIVMKVSDRIENKEQIFFDDTDKIQEKFEEKLEERVEEAREAEAEAEAAKKVEEFLKELDAAEEVAEETPAKTEEVKEVKNNVPKKKKKKHYGKRRR